ncbi:hypothetical protein [Methanoculleus taiwanensis]|uniref:hypothetical protein n=1 Tax=Methanoculleus taiwanensis TaxID=1550565 RepID=UPI001F4F15BC|nr:hypothetical protein [Methanoculleus taiwanensis]
MILFAKITMINKTKNISASDCFVIHATSLKNGEIEMIIKVERKAIFELLNTFLKVTYEARGTKEYNNGTISLKVPVKSKLSVHLYKGTSNTVLSTAL